MSRDLLGRAVEEALARWICEVATVQRDLERLEEVIRARLPPPPDPEEEHRVSVLLDTVVQSGGEIERLRGELATSRARVASLEDDASRIGRVLERQAERRTRYLVALRRAAETHGDPGLVGGLQRALDLMNDTYAPGDPDAKPV